MRQQRISHGHSCHFIRIYNKRTRLRGVIGTYIRGIRLALENIKERLSELYGGEMARARAHTSCIK